ncbi:MAG: toxin-antitoxin (TA) system antitoxin [Chloroflexi bacterium]|nr:toxin-antitoxin (TA) system antitoxin [Chloroflexota bacterium]
MTIKTIEIQESETDLKTLLSLVREGAEIILMQGDTPLARLAPVQETLMPRILGLHAHLGAAWISDDFNDPLPDEFWMGEE